MEERSMLAILHDHDEPVNTTTRRKGEIWVRIEEDIELIPGAEIEAKILRADNGNEPEVRLGKNYRWLQIDGLHQVFDGGAEILEPKAAGKVELPVNAPRKIFLKLTPHTRSR
jgi:hypothetical protein